MRKLVALAPLASALLSVAAAAHPKHPHPQNLPPAVFPPRATSPYQVAVDADPAHALNRFVPAAAFGAGVDGEPARAVPKIYTPSNVNEMLGAGFGALSYRLYTELSVQDWHWNTEGGFSDGSSGYWTSKSAPGKTLVDTYGYRLPRRGFTHDQGADDDYSRLDDGDLGAFWKSNPYLAEAYTGDPDGAHPQWVLFDLRGKKQIDAAKIWWGSPYAVKYSVQYWTGGDPIWDPAHGAWVDFPNGTVTDGEGGTVTLPLGAHKVRYLRIVMTQSSGGCTTPGSADPRDCKGYAIAEAGFGTLDHGDFKDVVAHRPDRRQTITYASSVDPWHASSDRVRDQEQPGLDIVFQSGVTRGLPTMVPIPMLYSTPDNAAAELGYLKARGYAIDRVEMGEEPDGQFVTPEDYAALYVQFADALHNVDPALQLGGPAFEDNSSDLKAWALAKHGESSWVKRFVAYLSSHGHLNDLSFFSFEHYPFGSCGDAKAEANLLREPDIVANIVSTWRKDNLPAGLPMFVTETNYSWNEADAAQHVTGALWYAEMMGTLLSTGANGGFFYEYEPIPLHRAGNCRGFGSYGVLLGDRNYKAQAPLSQYFAAQMLTQSWSVPAGGTHVLYPAAIAGGESWVVAYPLARPDGLWSLLLVNRDYENAHDVTVAFDTPAGPAFFSGNVAETQFGPAQYGWIEQGRQSHPEPDDPPATTTVSGGMGATYTLPAESVTVLTGALGAKRR
ncbi:MAG TPA: discoidin domain-containing protein [Rhizomicrobium sp.]|nr:discoidin domain-containing protein [Rhizomicrobium sp.]